MYIKKLFYKLTNKDKHFYYKMNLKKIDSAKQTVKLYKEGIEKKVIDIQRNIENKKELSFSHYGGLGDIICSLPVVKELSITHKCNFYIEEKKPFKPNAKNYRGFGDNYYLTETHTNKLLPLFMKQPYIHKVDKYTNQEIDIDLNLFREMPTNHDLSSIRWYFQLTGVHSNLSTPYLFVEPHKTIKNKVVIIRNTRRQNPLTNYKFLKKYKNLLFIGLNEEYEDLKKEVPNLEFYDCKDFLEMAQIVKSSKFFLGNLSFGYSIAEGLKVPRLLEAGPDFPVVYPYGKNAYDFYFQEHFEKWFSYLYHL